MAVLPHQLSSAEVGVSQCHSALEEIWSLSQVAQSVLHVVDEHLGKRNRTTAAAKAHGAVTLTPLG